MKSFNQIREAVRSADKKPEKYIDPQGKTKVRMVPVDKSVVKTEAKDPGEYDYEGEMAKVQLRAMIDQAEDLVEMFEDNENLPEWVQNKITKASDYIKDVYSYMEGQEEDDEEEDDEDEDV